MAIPPRPADTSEDAERVQLALLRAASLARRSRLALSMSAAAISAARRALVRNYPELSCLERDLKFVEVHYGPELALELREYLAARVGSARR